MGRPFLFILGFNILITLTGYTVVFGESGYLVRKKLSHRLTELKTDIEELKQEHELLSEQYLMMHGSTRNQNESEGEILDAIILKFDDSPLFPDKKLPADEVDLFQARILYFSAMGIWSVLSLYLGSGFSLKKRSS